MDIRIVEERHEQPTLFGPPLVSLVYRLADWDTYEMLNEMRYPTMGDAEKAVRNLLTPYLNRIAREHAERTAYHA